MSWQPIETAPKDGTLLILWGWGLDGDAMEKTESRVVFGRFVVKHSKQWTIIEKSETEQRLEARDFRQSWWQVKSWHYSPPGEDFTPTHWMPVPSPPTPIEGDAA